jgi:hypothetical protein
MGGEMKDKYFSSVWAKPDDRPRITACGFSGKKTAWISVEFKTSEFTYQVSKALVQKLMRVNKNNP